MAMQAAATSATGDTQRRLIEQPFYATLASAQSAALARSYRVLDHSTEEFRISTKATASREATWPRASVLWQPPPVNSTPLKFIFWMHTPKCGSSFTLTLSLRVWNPAPLSLQLDPAVLHVLGGCDDGFGAALDTTESYDVGRCRFLHPLPAAAAANSVRKQALRFNFPFSHSSRLARACLRRPSMY